MAARKAQPSRRSRVARSDRASIVPIGVRRYSFRDPYHFFLDASWGWVVLTLGAAFFAVNSVFALAYLACGDCIEHARPGSFTDAFFFSIQTIATIGYGTQVPHGVAANLLVTLEALCGLVGFGIVAGLAFAKFSRPTARVMFSKYAIVNRRDGVMSLQFRMGNERSNLIVEAQIHVSIARDDSTAEGERIRRISDLQMVRDRSVVFAVSWLAVHHITESSPLYGQTAESLAALNAEIVVSLVGIDETLAQTIYARHSYYAQDIAFGAHFADIVKRLPDGRPQADYTHFHEIVRGDEQRSPPPKPKSDPRA